MLLSIWVSECFTAAQRLQKDPPGKRNVESLRGNPQQCKNTKKGPDKQQAKIISLTHG